jgi:hypothetical protein
LAPIYDRFTEGFFDCGHADHANPVWLFLFSLCKARDMIRTRTPRLAALEQALDDHHNLLTLVLQPQRLQSLVTRKADS